jgi:hypothetical protein
MANVVTNVGKAIIAKRMIGSSPTQTEPKFVGWGTGTGTAAAADTALATEASESRVSGTGSTVTGSVTDDTHRVVGTLTAGGAKTITEAGVFDASTGGNLYVRSDFSGVPLNAGDSIQFTFDVKFV